MEKVQHYLLNNSTIHELSLPCVVPKSDDDEFCALTTGIKYTGKLTRNSHGAEFKINMLFGGDLENAKKTSTP